MRTNFSRKNFTKSERRFHELLKKLRVPFKAHVKINGREIDFVIGRYAIDIDCHLQDGSKNEMLVKAGYIPLHYTNEEIKEKLIRKLKC